MSYLCALATSNEEKWFCHLDTKAKPLFVVYLYNKTTKLVVLFFLGLYSKDITPNNPVQTQVNYLYGSECYAVS